MLVLSSLCFICLWGKQSQVLTRKNTLKTVRFMLDFFGLQKVRIWVWSCSSPQALLETPSSHHCKCHCCLLHSGQDVPAPYSSIIPASPLHRQEKLKNICLTGATCSSRQERELGTQWDLKKMEREVERAPWRGDARKVLGNSPGELPPGPLSQGNFMDEEGFGTGA